MDPNQQKEQFSVAYLRAVVAAAGYVCYKPEVDDDSVDWGIAAGRTAETPKRPRVELQLKCSARDILADDQVRYPLKIKNYDDLRTQELLVPRILVVVLVPRDTMEWLRHSEDELALRHCGYWVSLRGQPAVQNRETITSYLPRLQQFTADALKGIMQRISDGEVP
jgi:hypothetical protein